MKFAGVGKFVFSGLVSFSLSLTHVPDARASQLTIDPKQLFAEGQRTPSTDLKSIAKLPYTTPVITSHKTINFEVQPSSPSVPPPRVPTPPVKGATSPVTGLPINDIEIEGGILLAAGASLMLYGRKKSSRKSSKEGVTKEGVTNLEEED